MKIFRYSPALPRRPAFTPIDGLIVLALAALLYAGARLALRTPAVIEGPAISLSFRALPWYAALSVGRMAVAYLLSLAFSLAYGHACAHNRAAERLLMPLLDVLQSVPILSFLPVVLLGLSALLPQRLAAELAAIVLIFTSQAWNMTYSFYQSVKTLPGELREAAAIFRLSPWLRFRTLELPFAAIGLIWNSMMSWAGGWFFLMAAEIFNVGSRDFRLPGLGAYLQTAAGAGDLRAIFAGVATLVVVIVALDQLLWRPVLAWADRFKVEMSPSEQVPRSWFRDALRRSWLAGAFRARVRRPLLERLDAAMTPAEPDAAITDAPAAPARRVPWLGGAAAVLAVVAIGYGAARAAGLLSTLSASAWKELTLALGATFARVVAALLLALLWTVPVGVAIGTSRRLAALLQPVVQIVASIPATALFPVLLLALLRLPGGLNFAAVLLMLLGTQWYLLFNVIAGTSALPQDLRYTTALLRLSRWDRWKNLYLPGLMPYLVTGMITASGGAWNASIVAEHVQFGGETHSTVGVGALIARATSEGDYALLLGGTLALVLTVVIINRTFWRWLYRVAERRFSME